MNAKTETAKKPLSIQEPAEEAYESMWETSGYPTAISRRLAGIDRKAHGLYSLHELMYRDMRNLDCAKDCGEEYAGLSRALLEGLRLAQAELFDALVTDLDEIREARNKYGDAILKPDRVS